MVEEGDAAPAFTAPMATPENADDPGGYRADDVERFELAAALAEGPVVLAFFPGAFSRTCTEELCEIGDWRAELGDVDAAVYGVSADTPWSLLAFIDAYGLEYPLLSGFNNDVVEAYDVALREGLLAGIAERAVFVVDADGTVAYRQDAPMGAVPDLDAVAEAVAAL